jgi:methionyl-tRNA synthetase
MVTGMMIRKFSRDELASEPHSVLFKDLYPWDEIDDTPFGSSLAIVQVGGHTMLHSHDPAETFIICRGNGTISIDDHHDTVAAGDTIYLPPGSMHVLRNDSPTDELVFVSVFWKAKVEPRLAAGPRLLLPSPPTPNGPLHLGHLAGPYLLADVMRRYYRMHGIAATLVCVTDDHQSYVAERAQFEGKQAGELAAQFRDQIARTFERFDAAPDVMIATSSDAAYQAAVRARFDTLLAAGKLEAREVATLHCEACDQSLYDSYVTGNCPHCGTPSFGAICEVCNSPNDSADLAGAHCDRCKQPASVRMVRRLFFPLAPYRAALADYHRRLRLSPKLRKLAAQWLDRERAVPVSQVGTWGIAIAGYAGQIISPWFEVGLAGSYLREQYAPGGKASCFFGYDNAFLYLVQDPAISLALDDDGALPVELAPNEFLLLDDAKMSTSRSHVLGADDVLARVPADLVRLLLAKIRPEDSTTSANVQTVQMFLTMIPRFWQGWLGRLGAAIAGEADARAPAYANPSLAPWSAEQQQFLAQLGALVGRARQGYEAGSLKEVSTAIHELVERAVNFGTAQSNLAGIASLEADRATGLALELAAARTLAMIVAPVMPRFSAQLWTALGYGGAIPWLDDVGPLTPGQPIALATTQFFPLEG